jgi:hypothetical protein
MDSKQRQIIVNDIIMFWKHQDYSSDGIEERFILMTNHFNDKDYFSIKDKLENEMFRILKRKYDLIKKNPNRTIRKINWDTPFDSVQTRLKTIFDIHTLEGKKAGEITELGKLVRDEQNIHTEFVNKLTDNNLKKINETVVPKNQKTIDEICTAWINNNLTKNIDEIYYDMKFWGMQKTIITENDYMYRINLRNLWAKIKTYQNKEEYINLLKRLHEETNDSLGTCAQGHISRLANVLVGFEESYEIKTKSPEEFQNKIAEISYLDISLDDKHIKANILMDEFNICNRSEWLDAL